MTEMQQAATRSGRGIGEKLAGILGGLRGVRQRGEEYSAFCPVCESGKTEGDRHLYLTAEGDRILLHCKKGCTAGAVCAALGRTAADLFEQEEKPQPWEFLREHVYRGADGGILAKKAIYRRPGGDKTGVWYRYEKGRFLKSLDRLKPPVYNLPLIAGAAPDVRLWIAEGEKDADTLCSMGFTATCTPNGAGQAKIPDGCMEYFTGRDVVVMGDNDEPGRKYADILVRALRKTARQVVAVEPSALWEELPEKGDITDVFEALGEEETRAKLGEEVLRAVDRDLNLRPYIYREGKTECVSAPLLHAYMRGHEHFVFARSDAGGGVRRYIYRGGVYRHVSDDEFRGVIRGYLPVPLRSVRTIGEVFGLFSMDSDLFVSPSDLDSDENIINFRNGILCLGVMKLFPHSPEHLSSVQIPVAWDPDAKPGEGVFEHFLHDLTGGDAGKRQLILEFMGVALSNVPGYRMKKALFMYGPGNTGKSQCKELLIRLLGEEYFSGIDLDALEERFGTSQLFGKRLAGSSDMGYVTVRALRIIKLLTGGDSIFAEFKGENAFTFKFRGVLWFCANRLPRFGGDKGNHVYDRIMILPCSNVIENPDPLLLDKMAAEKDYVVRICVEAVKKLTGNKYRYTEPACLPGEMRKYRVENDSVLSFLEGCTEPRKPGEAINDRFTQAKVYRIYKNYCFVNNGGHAENHDVFSNTLKEEGVAEKILHGYKYYSVIPTWDAVREFDPVLNG